MATHINDLTGLQAMEDNLSEDYILDNDIDASDTSHWNSGAGFDPVGTAANPFAGSFDGGNFKITDLYINRPSTAYVGLFGVVDSANIFKDLEMQDCDITARDAAACFIGYDYGSAFTLSNIVLSGDLSCPADVGALIGLGSISDGATISDCRSAVNITAEATGGNLVFIGRLIGQCGENYTITRCSAIGDITTGNSTDSKSIDYIGGLIGSTTGGLGCNISKCFTKGNIITGNSDRHLILIGGFIGDTSANDIISDCYAWENISVGNAVDVLDYLGGFTGSARGSFSNCYSIGSITHGTGARGEDYIGGFAGTKSGSITNCFWDTTTSGLLTSAGGTGYRTQQMQAKSSYSGAAWDFDDIWTIL